MKESSLGGWGGDGFQIQKKPWNVLHGQEAFHLHSNKERVFTNTIMTKLTSNGKKKKISKIASEILVSLLHFSKVK
jgi:hypothetical protein